MIKTTNYVKVGNVGLVLRNQVTVVQKAGLQILVFLDSDASNRAAFPFATSESCEAAFKQLVIDLN